jgi:Holliday junction resolvase-like predicted endonuclease
MAAAFAWLHDTGFERIRDVHLTHSCDFIAQRNGVEHFIEVKGTTASLGSILLTANEVALHRSAHPHNILLVLHNIDLLEMRTKATGGTLHVSDPWDAATAQLTPLSYSCNLLVDAKSS